MFPPDIHRTPHHAQRMGRQHQLTIFRQNLKEHREEICLQLRVQVCFGFIDTKYGIIVITLSHNYV